MSAVEIRDVFRVHSSAEGEAAALQGMTLDVEDAEVVTVLGPSGSGKTTLLRTLAGFERPSVGTVRVFGHDVGRLSGRAAGEYRARTIGYVEQHYARALAPELTARELVAVRLGLAGMPKRARIARADKLLERVGLLGRAEALPRELSGGEQQRVAVCAALAHGPRLLLADEPTGELDRETAGLVYALLGDLVREERCTAVIVSHDPRAAEVADRALEVRDGKLSGEWRLGAEGEEIVVGRGGWLRVSEDVLARAGIRRRAAVEVEADSVLLRAVGEQELPERAADTVGGEMAPREPGEMVAALRGIEKSYGTRATGTSVFKDLAASFRSGRFHAVTGRSGSGKTTLLHLLAGLERPERGSVTVLGTEVTELDRAARAEFRRDHIGFVGQQPGLTQFLTAEENIALALEIQGRSDASFGEARALLAAVGLEDRARDRVGHLSMGERVRVAVGRALAARPPLLLVDEPTARLDQANALSVARLLVALAHEQGTAVVCATHDPVALAFADEEIALGGAKGGTLDPASAAG
jgi:ABC-type lipoprotein export system ATPase subunit